MVVRNSLFLCFQDDDIASEPNTRLATGKRVFTPYERNRCVAEAVGENLSPRKALPSQYRDRPNTVVNSISQLRTHVRTYATAPAATLAIVRIGGVIALRLVMSAI